ncbi:unnamed protein product [Urochloa humidicola]
MASSSRDRPPPPRGAEIHVRAAQPPRATADDAASRRRCGAGAISGSILLVGLGREGAAAFTPSASARSPLFVPGRRRPWLEQAPCARGLELSARALPRHAASSVGDLTSFGMEWIQRKLGCR